MKFTHLIVSRVNIRWTEQSKDEKWLRDRIFLLNRTLRPSIQAQTNKNFKFVTLWGYDPIDVINVEHAIKTESVGLVKIFDDVLIELKKLIDEENVLVTRIDSDNSLGDDFVETLHKAVKETELPFYYDISKHYMYHTKTKEKRIWPFEKTTGFISVMEKTSDFTCIPYHHNHGKIGNVIKGTQVEGLDTLVNIHENNLSAKMLGKLTDFDISKFNLKL